MSSQDTTPLPKPSEDSLKMLESLRQAVHKALERKRRLGQYYVVWQDGRPVAIGDDAPSDSKSDPGQGN